MMSRVNIARVIAVSADAVQLGLFPLFIEGAASIFDAVLDVAVCGALTWLVGWHIAFLPGFVFKCIPMVDLAPTWTIAILIATRKKKDAGNAPAVVEPAAPPPPPAPPRIGPGAGSGTNFGERGAIGWPTAVMWMAISAIAAIAAMFIFKSCADAPAKLVTSASNSARELASSLLKGNVTMEFHEYCAKTEPSLSLQVATLKQMELFTRSDEASVGNIPLPDVVVSVTSPVEYVYSLDLNERWTFELKDETLRVRAPDPKPGSPSFDVSNMKWIVEKDSLIRNTTRVKDDLKQSLMPMAIKRGRVNVALIRETARAQTAQFVERWLKSRFPDAAKYRVKVEFEGDILGSGDKQIDTTR